MTQSGEQSTTVGPGASDAQTSPPDSPNDDRGIRQGIQTDHFLGLWRALRENAGRKAGNFASSAISWLRRPVAPDPEENMRTALNAPYDPDTVDALLDKYEQRQKELLDWSDSLDRKLLAVITADGVYAALFSSVSVRSPVPILVVVLVGISVIASIVLAYTAWRPHPHATVPIDGFVSVMDIHPHDLQRILIVAHKSASRQVYGLNSWKAQKLTAAATCLAIGVLATICYAIIGCVL